MTTGLVARFELYNTSIGANGITRVVLFDQPGEGAPLTVQNFRDYVEDGDYINTLIHRSVPGFVIQGGGFIGDGWAEAIANNTPSEAISLVPTNPPVQNEFSSDRSNLRGTIAMAKLPNQPNSATSQWFFNLADNTDLDTSNGGFTVFGKVMSAVDMEAVDEIAALPRFNAVNYFQQGAFTDLPLVDFNPQNVANSSDANFVRYRSITIDAVDELTFQRMF